MATLKDNTICGNRMAETKVYTKYVSHSVVTQIEYYMVIAEWLKQKVYIKYVSHSVGYHHIVINLSLVMLDIT